jgi:hypothetical protein
MAKVRASAVILNPSPADIRLARGGDGDLFLFLDGRDVWFTVRRGRPSEAGAMDKLALAAGEAAREVRGDTDPAPRPGDLWVTGGGMVWFAMTTDDGRDEVVLFNGAGDGFSPDEVAGLYGPLTLIHRQPATAQGEDGGDE